jgi:regulator of protease activity HflC (stomatin/prohibitin superfamily)
LARARKDTPGGSRFNIISVLILFGCVAIGAAITAAIRQPWPIVLMLVVGLILMRAPQLATQWERAVVLKLARFVGLRGPGLFWIVPFVDRVSSWIDQRSNPWGVTVSSVEMRDVVIPVALQAFDANTRNIAAIDRLTLISIIVS